MSAPDLARWVSAALRKAWADPSPKTLARPQRRSPIGLPRSA